MTIHRLLPGAADSGLIGLLVSTLLAVLTGCTSYAVGVSHNRELLTKLTDVSVAWIPNDSIKVYVTRTDPLASMPVYSNNKKESAYASYREPATVTDDDKRLASNNTRLIMRLFSTRLKDQLGRTLAAKKVNLRPDGTAGIPEIRITPSSGHTECVPLGCVDSLWVQVSVVTGSDRKEAWSARIRSRTSQPGEIEDVMVKEFADTLTKNLQDSGLF